MVHVNNSKSKNLLELMPGSTGGWMALVSLVVALINLTAQQWGITQADPQTTAVWRDVVWASLGVHAARRAFEGRKNG